MPYTAKDVVKAQFKRLKKQLESNVTLTQEQKRKTERSMIGWSFNNYELADAPLIADGMTGYAVAFITDGRKQGESAGLGTGIPAYFDYDTDTWLKFSTDTAVLT